MIKPLFFEKNYFELAGEKKFRIRVFLHFFRTFELRHVWIFLGAI